MKLGLLTRNPDAWCSLQIRKAMKKRGIEPVCFWFKDLEARVRGGATKVRLTNGLNPVKEVSALIVRPIGRGSLDETIFRLNVLHRMEKDGLLVVNPPSAIEKAVDKYYALTLLEEKNIPVPRTVVTENPDAALEAFQELGGDVVVKPVFGSRGMGVTRVSDLEVARRIFNALVYMRNVLYIQEFIPHGRRDYRAFVVGEKVVAAMLRKGKGWKTNVSQGASPIAIGLSKKMEALAVKSVKALGCQIGGVDIIESSRRHIVNEVNSQPGFRGLQSVSKSDIAQSIVDYVALEAKK